MSHYLKRILELGGLSNIYKPFEMNTPMIFVTGARQIGKTRVVRNFEEVPYYNWDTKEVKRAYLRDPYFFRQDKPLVIFDEIHKRRDWKKLLKGYYDSPERKENFIVTGSGHFDQYQRSGDSLQGRYNSFQLWPLSIDELRLNETNAKWKLAPPRNWAEWKPESHSPPDEALIRLGGFPAPFMSGNEQSLRRWQDLYLKRLIEEDLRDLSNVQRLDQIEMLARLLPDRVANPLSILNLSQDIDASPIGVRSWIRLFEMLFFGFLLRPFHYKIHRAVKKEPKWYFQQWTFVRDPGCRFENYIAVQLASALSSWSEQGFGRWELFYLRDQDRREVDFLISHELVPIALVEAKSSESAWNSSIEYYSNKLKIPGFVTYPQGATRKVSDGKWCLSSSRLLKGLWLHEG